MFAHNMFTLIGGDIPIAAVGSQWIGAIGLDEIL